MRTRLFVGNIPFTATDVDIREFFAGFDIIEIKIITDRETGRQRGFAFVTLGSPAEAQRAVQTLDNTDMGGRKIVVNEAKERERTHSPRTYDAPRVESRHRNGRSTDRYDRD